MDILVNKGIYFKQTYKQIHLYIYTYILFAQMVDHLLQL